MRWSQFAEMFRKRWEPGQHVALIGPTGVGKSTLAVNILPLRRYVVVLDLKGGDSTVRTLQKKGFKRISTWPPPKRLWREAEEGQPLRLIVGPELREISDRPKQIEVFRSSLQSMYAQGGWTVYVDELQVAAERMKLGEEISELLVAGRDRGLSLVSSYQRPANVPRAASEMATWVAVWYTRDVDTVNRLAEMVGRPKPEIRGAIRGLEDHCILLFSRNPREPIIAVRAPRVA